MTVVSSKEFINNEDKYFEMAVDEPVFVKKGDYLFLVQNFIQNEKKSKSRQGWAEAAKEFVKSNNEEFFFSDIFEDEDLSWWH